LSSLNSFNNLEKFWLRESKRNSGDRLIQILVGNKSDLNREISKELIKEFSDKYKMKYFELNGKDVTQVTKFFSDLGSILI
jgi:GTPase SAR1 family protein